MSQQLNAPAIEVSDLTKIYKSPGGRQHKALDSVSFKLGRGQTMAIVGESGAGKTTLVRCIAGLESPTSGKVLIEGKQFKVRAGSVSPIQMVFQNPTDALDPMRSIGSSIGEPLRSLSRRVKREHVEDLLRLVGLNASRYSQRPSTFSGGQLQRVVIARALAPGPRVLLCDEPTSALDVSVQAQIINLLLNFQDQYSFANVIVTHDLAVANALSDYVLVLHRGRTVFSGSMHELLDPDAVLDPYVSTLLEASRASDLSLSIGRAGEAGTPRPSHAA
jgi:ABC-type glutathione transport system ATPase component